MFIQTKLKLHSRESVDSSREVSLAFDTYEPERVDIQTPDGYVYRVDLDKFIAFAKVIIMTQGTPPEGGDHA